jgi:hypothetical protein
MILFTDDSDSCLMLPFVKSLPLHPAQPRELSIMTPKVQVPYMSLLDGLSFDLDSAGLRQLRTGIP